MADTEKAFLEAAKSGNVRAIESLLADPKPPSLACVDSSDDSKNALHYASEKGHYTVVKLLLERGANVNSRNKKDSTALHFASLFGHVKTVELLLQQGASVVAVNNSNATPLHLACWSGQTETAKLLFNYKADINARLIDKSTAVHIVCQNGHLETLKLLLDRGADPNATRTDNSSPLFLSCQYGRTDLARILLERGADVNAQRDNASPLYIASTHGHVDTVRLLLSYKADLNIANKNQWAPLHIASREGHTAVVKLLLDRSADFTARDSNGKTPADLAQENGKTEIVNLLKASEQAAKAAKAVAEKAAAEKAAAEKAAAAKAEKAAAERAAAERAATERAAAAAKAEKAAAAAKAKLIPVPVVERVNVPQTSNVIVESAPRLSSDSTDSTSSYTTKPFDEWSVDDVGGWLSKLDVSPQVIAIFQKERIRGRMLPKIATEDALRKIGVVALGDLDEIVQGVRKLTGSNPTSTTIPASKPAIFYDVFISYRRDHGSELARLICLSLRERGFKPFLDVDLESGLSVGQFDQALVAAVKASSCFLLLLTEGALDRCLLTAENHNKDWVRKEIATAFAAKKEVVPLMSPKFSFPSEELLPLDIRKVTTCNAVPWSHEYTSAVIERLIVFIRKAVEENR